MTPTPTQRARHLLESVQMTTKQRRAVVKLAKEFARRDGCHTAILVWNVRDAMTQLGIEIEAAR